MPNYKVITSASEPLLVLNNQPYTDASNNGQVFDVTTGEITMVASGFMTAQLTIPANTDKTVYILRLVGGTTANTTLDLLENAGFAASGTSITPVNNNYNYSGGSVCTAKYLNQATDPTSGGVPLISIVQTGGGTLLPFDGRIVIPSSTSDRTFYLRLRNKSNTTNICAMSLAYWEV